MTQLYIRIYKTTDSARFIQSINYTNRFYYIFANILSTKICNRYIIFQILWDTCSLVSTMTKLVLSQSAIKQ